MAEHVPGYKLIRLLGRGGMGSVYLAQRASDGRTVALKVARSQLGEHGMDRLRREAELLGRIQSPYLPAFVEAKEVDGRFLLAMDFVRGDPLQPFVDEPGEPEERLDVVRRCLPGLAQGLLALHEAEIIHRDLKPANAILTEDRCVLVDLGLARGPEVMTLTKTGLSVGTPEYLPPEQVSGEPAGPAADVYQLALMARDLLLGSRRRPGQDVIQEAMKRAVARPQDPREEGPWIPAELAAWIQAALHPSPAQRPEPAQHLGQLVELCAAPLRPAIPAGPGPREVSWLGSETHTGVLEARKAAEAQGWPEGEKAPAVPEWMESEGVGRGKAAQGRPKGPTPAAEEAGSSKPRRGLGVGAVLLGVVLGLGAGVGFFGGDAATSSASSRPRLVLTRNGDTLTVIEGPDELRLVEPVEKPFTRDDQGRLSVELPGKASTILVRDLESEWSAELPQTSSASSSLLADLSMSPRGAKAKLALTPTGRTLRLGSEGFSSIVPTWTSPWVDVPHQMVETSPWTIETDLGESIWLSQELDFSRGLAILERELPIPPSIDLRDKGAALVRAGTILSRLTEELPRFRFIMSSGLLDEEIRYIRYKQLQSLRMLEWFTQEAPPTTWAPANSLLGVHLGLSVSGSLNPRAVFNNQAIERAIYSEIRIGRPLHPEDEDPLRVGKTKEIEVIDTSRVRLTFSGFAKYRSEAPRLAELSIHGTGFEGWTQIQVEMGGRMLYLPAGSPSFWRTHRVPPRWLQAAVTREGNVHLVISLDRSNGLDPAYDARIDQVRIRVAF